MTYGSWRSSFLLHILHLNYDIHIYVLKSFSIRHKFYQYTSPPFNVSSLLLYLSPDPVLLPQHIFYQFQLIMSTQYLFYVPLSFATQLWLATHPSLTFILCKTSVLSDSFIVYVLTRRTFTCQVIPKPTKRTSVSLISFHSGLIPLEGDTS